MFRHLGAGWSSVRCLAAVVYCARKMAPRLLQACRIIGALWKFLKVPRYRLDSRAAVEQNEVCGMLSSRLHDEALEDVPMALGRLEHTRTLSGSVKNPLAAGRGHSGVLREAAYVWGKPGV